MSDEEMLREYVEIWWQAIDDFTRLLEQLSAEQWTALTDLPGWTVRDVAAHTAHLEAGLVGVPHDQVDIGSPDHVKGTLGIYIEQGVVGRRERDTDDLIREIRESATKRHTFLLSSPPTDASETADGFAALLGWSWDRLLRNRPLDVWMHEQDVRRAVGMPGNLDSAPAQHAADYLLESIGMVVGKRVSPPAGTTVVVDVDGSAPVAVEVGEDGRARPAAAVPHSPTVRLGMSREDFIVAAGGRRPPRDVRVEGDEELAARIVASLAVTP